MEKTIGEVLKEIRTVRQLSQKAFADVCNVGAGTIADVETGKKGTKEKTVLQILESIEATPQEREEALLAITPEEIRERYLEFKEITADIYRKREAERLEEKLRTMPPGTITTLLEVLEEHIEKDEK